MYKMKQKNIRIILILLCIVIFLLLIIYKYNYSFETFINIQTKPDELFFGKNKTSEIPNKLWCYWHDEKLPEIIKICTDSWKKYNPNYEIVILNNKLLKTYLPDIDFESMRRAKDSPARFSDFVRLCILDKYGGIWIDASSVCNQSFSWVNAIQNNTKCECVCYYIVFNKDDTDIIKDSPVIESWFIACTKGSKFIHDWKNEFLRINNFQNVELYLEDIKKNGTDISKVNIQEYLAIHCSAQVILQKNVGKYDICCFNAKLSPYRFWIIDSDDDPVKTVDNLLDKEKCKKFKDLPFLKFIGTIRHEIERRDNMQDLKYYISGNEE